MAATWTRKTTRLCRFLSRRPLVTSSCQLVVASPLVVLSLCRSLVVLSRELVVTLPLAVLSLCHPLVLSLSQLVVTSLLLVLLLCRPLFLLSRRLVVVSSLTRCPLFVSSSWCLVVSSYCHLRCLILLSSLCVFCLVVPPSHRLVTPAGCRIISHHPLVVPPSCPLIVPSGCCCLSLCPPLVLSSCRQSFDLPT